MNFIILQKIKGSIKQNIDLSVQSKFHKLKQKRKDKKKCNQMDRQYNQMNSFFETLSLNQNKSNEKQSHLIDFNGKQLFEQLPPQDQFSKQELLKQLPPQDQFSKQELLKQLPPQDQFSKQELLKQLPPQDQFSKQELLKQLPPQDQFSKHELLEQLPSQDQFNKKKLLLHKLEIAHNIAPSIITSDFKLLQRPLMDPKIKYYNNPNIFCIPIPKQKTRPQTQSFISIQNIRALFDVLKKEKKIIINDNIIDKLEKAIDVALTEKLKNLQKEFMIHENNFLNDYEIIISIKNNIFFCLNLLLKPNNITINNIVKIKLYILKVIVNTHGLYERAPMKEENYFIKIIELILIEIIDKTNLQHIINLMQKINLQKDVLQEISKIVKFIHYRIPQLLSNDQQHEIANSFISLANYVKKELNPEDQNVFNKMIQEYDNKNNQQNNNQIIDSDKL